MNKSKYLEEDSIKKLVQCYLKCKGNKKKRTRIKKITTTKIRNIQNIFREGELLGSTLLFVKDDEDEDDETDDETGIEMTVKWLSIVLISNCAAFVARSWFFSKNVENQFSWPDKVESITSFVYSTASRGTIDSISNVSETTGVCWDGSGTIDAMGAMDCVSELSFEIPT